MHNGLPANTTHPGYTTVPCIVLPVPKDLVRQTTGRLGLSIYPLGPIPCLSCPDYKTVAGSLALKRYYIICLS